jgi:hypothetical protein
MRLNTHSVVLAKAGTHNPWRSIAVRPFNKATYPNQNIGDTAYGSPPSSL